MIGRWTSKAVEEDQVEPQGFDAFELRLGDLMRGERATMGKSLLDVQRELRIKAAYIAAIENCDPDAFDTPGFIAGYVRSYARYLNMDPDVAFDAFCAESGFSVAHGMSADASVIKKTSREERLGRGGPIDPIAKPAMAFAPTGESFLSRIEPGAVGSSMVLLALIGGIGFGGWTVLKEVQRVQVTPVDQTPVVLSDLDPIETALAASQEVSSNSAAPAALDRPRADALDRLYRPQALDVPVMVARDGAIATLDPRIGGVFAEEANRPALMAAASPNVPSLPTGVFGPAVPQVVEGPAAPLRIVAAYEAWVRVRSADGTTIYEGIMNKGDMWEVPATEEPATLRTGASGAVYFAMNNDCYGPVGQAGTVTSNVALSTEALAEVYQPVDPLQDNTLGNMFADLRETLEPSVLAAMPCQTR
jgi:hypothetical protein